MSRMERTMTTAPAVKVGILVFLAVVALVLVLGFLRGWSFGKNTYAIVLVLDNALGMMEGDLVRMAGVPIGDVEALDLTTQQRAKMTLRINRKYQIPEGSQFIARVGLLIGERYIEIVPNRSTDKFLKPGARITGQVPRRIEDVLPDAQELVTNLTVASRQLREILGDETLRSGFRQSIGNVELATNRLCETLGTVNKVVARNQDEVDRVAKNIAAASESVRAMAAELERIASDQRLHQDIADTVRTAKKAVESLDRALASLDKIVTSPEFQENIHQTFADARRAVQEARQVIGKVDKLLPNPPEFKPGVPSLAVNLDMLYSAESDRFVAELTTLLPKEKDRFLKLGLYDLGAGNKLIAQSGRRISRNTSVRYGIYASRLGIGVDRTLSPKTFGYLDLYDSYEPKLNLRAGYKVTNDWSVLVGIDNLFDENRFAAGVRLRK